MKKSQGFYLHIFIVSLLLIGFFTTVGYGQEKKVEKAEVPLSDPSKPSLVKVGLLNGGITVTGYEGKTIMVEAITGGNTEKGDKEDKEDKEPKKNIKGMHLIQASGSGLTVIEENNIVTIKPNSIAQQVNLIVKVPFKTSLKLNAVNEGNITVEKVDGSLEVEHVNGELILKEIGGTVVANTVNGDVTVQFTRVNLDKPMSISSFNGDVDVTLPEEAKFNLKIKSDRGEIYSDFELKIQTPPVAEQTKKKDGKFIVKLEKMVFGLLNGGGEEFQLKTFNGDIYIRKKK